MKIVNQLILFSFLSVLPVFGQEDSVIVEDIYVEPEEDIDIFGSTRIINGHSVYAIG